MSLVAKQSAFAGAVAKLVLEALDRGYLVTFGEAYRPEETAALYEEQGRGIANSNHTRRLAIDLNLFLYGQYLTDSEHYRELGEWWKRESTDEYTCAWGGDFSRPDGNHFSFEHNGVR